MPEKKPFITLEQAQEIIADVPTPFHLYDEKGIRANARLVNKAFAWNKGFKEYFAVKATPNPYLLRILKEEGCGVDWLQLHRTAAERSLWLQRQRYHVLLQRNAGAGHEEGI